MSDANAHDVRTDTADSLTPQAVVPAPKKRDWLDVLQTLSSVLVPITVAFVGFLASAYLDRRQTEETKSRFYIDLLSKREDADSALRTNMFNAFINKFIDPKFNDLSTRVLGLELLEANFHESIDLSPLFRDFATQLRSAKAGTSPELMARLKWITQEVKDKQTFALTGSGGLQIQMNSQLLDGLPKDDNADVEPVLLWDDDTELPADPVTRTSAIPVHITVSATALDAKAEQIHIKLNITTRKATASIPVLTDLADSSFWLGLYDLPVINNTRLTSSLRCAVVLNEFSLHKPSQIALLIFPASRASTKDKPYLDEMISRTLDHPKASDAAK